MKHWNYILGLFFINFFMLSCINDVNNEIPITTKVGRNELEKRTLDEALSLAKSSISLLNPNKTRGSFERTINLDDMRVVRTNAETRSLIGVDTLMYVFNFEDSLGFAIISAHKSVPGLIAVTESGFYDPEKEQKEEIFADVIERSKIYVRNVLKSPPPLIFDLTYIVDTIEVDSGPAPYVSVKWGSGGIYGKYCKNGNAGCAPVAVAQALTYFRNINNITLSYSGRDMNSQTLDWDDIDKHILTYYPTPYEAESQDYCTASDSAHNAIGRLCRQIGQEIGTDYTYNSMTLFPNNISTLLHRWGFPNLGNFKSYSNIDISGSLKNGHIIMIMGKGHIWLIDGYLIVKKYEIDNWGDMTEIGRFNYNHLNWGWNGICNGYYLENIFNTDNVERYDSIPYNHFSNGDYSDASLKCLDVHL